MSANPERGEVDLLVGDRSYVLRMRNVDLRALQKRTGRSYGQLLNSLGTIDVEAITELLFTFLQPNHAKQFKTLEQVDALIDELHGHAGVVAALMELWKANRPPDKEGQGNVANPPDAQVGTGDSSGLTPEASA